MQRWTYLIRGTDGEGDAWKAAGIVMAADANAALGHAQRETFNGLHKQAEANPNAGCGGPYKLTHLNVEIIV